MNKKVGIIYSETTADHFFDKQAYSQLFASMQYQATMAGIPFELLTEVDLTDITKIFHCQTLIFPSFQNIQKNRLQAIEDTLRLAVFKYKIGMIVSGNFITNDENGKPLSGDPYQRMKELLDLNITHSQGLRSNVNLKIQDVDNAVGQRYIVGETIDIYPQQISVNSFDGYRNSPIIIAEQIVDNQTLNAILATLTGGRNIHFSNDIFLNKSNLVWQCLQWSIYGDSPKIGLSMTRNSSLFVSRDDVDLSKYAHISSNVGHLLTNILTRWKRDYGFVGTHFINIGCDPSHSILNPNISCIEHTHVNVKAGEYTDWKVMSPIYQKWLDLGNEIATHSWTHPFETNDLNSKQLAAEFDRSKQEISRRLGITVTGASIPGNPENLAVDLELSKYFAYITGVGSTYANAIGYLNPDTMQTVYFVPNIDSDFNLVEFKQLTPDRVITEWEQQFAHLTRHTDRPIVEFHWHDYGVTGMGSNLYDPDIYHDFIAKAAASGTEFVTFNDLQHRFQTFHTADLVVEQLGNLILVEVLGDRVGTFGVKIDSNLVIQSVTNWYAYNEKMVFLPQNGGKYQIKLGDRADSITHIDRLPQRAQLLAVQGNGRDLAFQMYGEGTVRISLATPRAENLIVEGADSYQVTDHHLELTCDRDAKHTIQIRSQRC